MIRGNQTLFMRRDEVEAAWDWVDPILRAWTAKSVKAQGLHGWHMGTRRLPLP